MIFFKYLFVSKKRKSLIKGIQKCRKVIKSHILTKRMYEYDICDNFDSHEDALKAARLFRKEGFYSYSRFPYNESEERWAKHFHFRIYGIRLKENM